jgi:hypothetical protein
MIRCLYKLMRGSVSDSSLFIYIGSCIFIKSRYGNLRGLLRGLSSHWQKSYNCPCNRGRTPDIALVDGHVYYIVNIWTRCVICKT